MYLQQTKMHKGTDMAEDDNLNNTPGSTADGNQCAEDSTNKIFQKLEKAIYGEEKSFVISTILSILPGMGLVYLRQIKRGIQFLIVEFLLLSAGYILGGLPGMTIWIVSIVVWLLQIWHTFVKYNEYKEYFDKTGRAPW